MKLPYIKFFTRDWQADPELRMCSLEARGLWMELLCIMHNANRRGYLESPQGHPLSDEDIMRLTGTFKGDLYRCKSELLKHGVPSVCEESGIWYCRRMVKEAIKAKKCAEAGKMGGGNPALIRHSLKKIKKIPDTRYHISLKVTFKGAEYDSPFEAFWKHYPRKVAVGTAKKAFEAALKKEPDYEKIINAMIEQSKAWETKDKKYIPHASTWLNGERWNDQIETTASNQPPKMRDMRQDLCQEQ